MEDLAQMLTRQLIGEPQMPARSGRDIASRIQQESPTEAGPLAEAYIDYRNNLAAVLGPESPEQAFQTRVKLLRMNPTDRGTFLRDRGTQTAAMNFQAHLRTLEAEVNLTPTQRDVVARARELAALPRVVLRMNKVNWSATLPKVNPDHLLLPPQSPGGSAQVRTFLSTDWLTEWIRTYQTDT